MESDHSPESGDLYRHTQTQAHVIVLTVKNVAGETVVRLGRPGHDTPLETDLETFLAKFEWLEINVLNERAQLDEVGVDVQQD